MIGQKSSKKVAQKAGLKTAQKSSQKSPKMAQNSGQKVTLGQKEAHKMGRKKGAGGSRPGSGRPKGTGRYKEATRPIRVPQSLLPEVHTMLSYYAETREQQKSEMENDFKNVFKPDLHGKNVKRFPLYATRVAAGFPSPADDYIEAKLDLNQHLVKHPTATFFVRVEGDSMIGAGIHQEDILVVDRAVKPTDGKIVIAVVNGELTVKRLKMEKTKLKLLAENERYKPIEITEEMNFSIWGVVTSVIHAL